MLEFHYFSPIAFLMTRFTVMRVAPHLTGRPIRLPSPPCLAKCTLYSYYRCFCNLEVEDLTTKPKDPLQVDLGEEVQYEMDLNVDVRSAGETYELTIDKPSFNRLDDWARGARSSAGTFDVNM